MPADLHHITDFANLADKTTKLQGINILHSDRVTFARINPQKREAIIKFREKAYENQTVVIKEYLSPAISSTCTCHSSGKLCQHQVAALYYLKAHYYELLNKYNYSFYPNLPKPEPNTRYLQKFLDYLTPNNPNNTTHTDLQWINPLFQTSVLNVEGHTVQFNFIFDSLIKASCTCGEKKCEHKAKAADFLLSYVKTKSYSNILKAYLRKEDKALLIGKPHEITKANLHFALPYYLPENYQLIYLKENFVELKIKVRYKPIKLWFLISNGKVFSRCYCQDKVTGICKHQIAALHMLNELDSHFFEHLSSDEHIEDLKAIFV